MRLPTVSLTLTIGLIGAALGFSGCTKPATVEPEHEAHSAAPAAKYHCPMHPTYVSDRPGDCPICGMKLVPIVSSDSGHEAHAEAPAAAGRTSISLSADKRQLIGLSLVKVENRELALTVRTTAVVQHDETRYARIAPRFGGWVRKLAVNFTGAPVEKGQTLFTVYSPELYTTESDYLIAWRAAQQLPAEAPSAQRDATKALLEAARMRLALWEVGDEELREIEQRGTASQELAYRAPLSGHVLSKTAVDGKAFMAGETLYEIADLSHLELRVYLESGDLERVKLGQELPVRVDALPGAPLRGTIAWIADEAEFTPKNAQTRNARAQLVYAVKLRVDNPDGKLHVGMPAEIDLP